MASLARALLISDIEQQLDWLCKCRSSQRLLFFFVLSCLDVRDQKVALRLKRLSVIYRTSTPLLMPLPYWAALRCESCRQMRTMKLISLQVFSLHAHFFRIFFHGIYRKRSRSVGRREGVSWTLEKNDCVCTV